MAARLGFACRNLPYTRRSNLPIPPFAPGLQNRGIDPTLRKPHHLFNKEADMDNGQMQQQIKEANLTYLMLAQNLIRQDRAEALFRLGLPEESADLLAALSPAQLLKVASCSMLLCRMRIDDDMVWGLLTSHNLRKTDGDGAARMHANILLAGRHAEAA